MIRVSSCYSYVHVAALVEQPAFVWGERCAPISLFCNCCPLCSLKCLFPSGPGYFSRPCSPSRTFHFLIQPHLVIGVLSTSSPRVCFLSCAGYGRCPSLPNETPKELTSNNSHFFFSRALLRWNEGKNSLEISF